jgi:hypothetical protein
MNINTAEQSLAKYHILHFVMGAILAAFLLVLPKLLGAFFTVVLFAIFVPEIVLPEFRNHWINRGAVLLGAISIAVLFHFLHKL